MINGLEGVPGSGKSYESSVIHVLAALKRGRKVITNLPLNVDAYAAIDPSYRDLLELRTTTQPIRGTWDATRKNAYELFPDGSVKTAPDELHMFASVWDYYTDWKHPTEGFGPLFVVDECHVALSKENASKLKEVVQWFKLHRHFNADVLLMTQTFRDVVPSIAALIGMLIRVRKADIIGKEGYIRKVFGGYRGGLVSTEHRQYDPGLFQLYTSHTQGGAVAEFKATDVKSVMVGWRKKQRIVIIVALIAAGFALWLAMRDKPKPPKRPPVAAKAMEHPTPQPKPERLQQAQPDPAPGGPEASEVAQGKDPEPYGTSGLHMTGRMTMGTRTIYTFLVSHNGAPSHATTDSELVGAGYTWRALSDCAGILEWKGKRRAVTCSVPQQTMAVAGVKVGG